MPNSPLPLSPPPLAPPSPDDPIGVLLSGGLDSAILLGWLLELGHWIQPFYVRCGLTWEDAEQQAAADFLAVVASPRLQPLVTLDMPLADLYGDHWSTTGRQIPDFRSPDEAVFLPGRNPLLLVKACLWCQLHSIRRLALAPLGSNPFADASDDFFRPFEQAMSQAMSRPIEILRPFAELHKSDVMQLGRNLPLERTLSCIAPRVGTHGPHGLHAARGTQVLHCGECNKCAERQAAFRDARLADPTRYANSPASVDTHGDPGHD